MKQPYYTKYSMGQPFGNYTEVLTGSGNYKRGYYVTKIHTVLVYAEDGLISLSIYIDGIGYHKSIQHKGYPSDLSLSRAASKFSKEIGGKQ